MSAGGRSRGPRAGLVPLGPPAAVRPHGARPAPRPPHAPLPLPHVAHSMAWGNSHGRDPKGTVSLDIADRLEEQTLKRFK